MKQSIQRSSPMAITTSSGLSPANFYHPLHNSTKLTISKTLHHFISPQRANSRFIITQSSVFTSPVLDEEEEEPSPVLPLVNQLSYKESKNDIPPPKYNKVIIDLLGDSSMEHLAMDYYEKAKAVPEFQPNKTMLKSLLRYLLRSKKWNLISLVVNDMKMYQVFPDEVFCGRIVSACIEARKFKVSDMIIQCFATNAKIAPFAYGFAFRTYNKIHMYRVVLSLYKRMRSSGVLLGNDGYIYVMKAFIKVGRYDIVVELFSELEEGDKLDNVENLPQLYGVLIEALLKLGQGLKAVEKVWDMRHKGISVNAGIYASLIIFLAEMKNVKVVEELVKEAELEKMLKDPALFLKLVVMYVEVGTLERTLHVVKLMKGANLEVSDCVFSSILNGFVKKRGMLTAARVYRELVSQGCVPGQVTYSIIINVYFRTAVFHKAREVFEEMIDRGFDQCVVAYSTMIRMYGKMGHLREAMKLLAKMKERGCEPNVWVYNALLDLHGKAKDLRQVDKIWKEMARKKVKPDQVSYTSIIAAYSKGREYEMCMNLFDEYRRNGGKADLAMAGMMVGIYSKLDRVDELIRLLQEMKDDGTKLDERLYTSALNAFKDTGLQLQVKWFEESFGTMVRPMTNSRRYRTRPQPLDY